MREYEQLKYSCELLGYKWYNGAYNLNCIWERTNNIITNKFTDFLHICYDSNETKGLIFTIPATTKPGLKGSILEPVTVNGITGTAIIQPGQYLSAWEFRDTGKEFSEYPYFRQIAGINYWRDFDKDNVIDEVQPQLNKIFGTHWHRMSQNNTYGSGLVNNWSLGCMGSPEPEFEKILPLIREGVKKYGNKFTGTIIESKNIK